LELAPQLQGVASGGFIMKSLTVLALAACTSSASTAGPDAAAAPSAHIMIADLAGTGYTASGPSPGAHQVFAYVDTPSQDQTSEYSDASCSVGRLTSFQGGAGGSLPANVDAGAVKISGLASSLVGTREDGMIGPAPSSFACAFDGAVYRCVYDPNATGPIASQRAEQVILPAEPCAAGTCAQHALTASGTVSVSLAGGNGYDPIQTTLPAADGVTITAITGGGATAAASMNLGDVVLDPMTDLAITWQCNGGDCGSDAMTLYALTANQTDPAQFEPMVPFGTARCDLAASAGTLALSHDAIAALLGDQRGGLVKLWMYRSTSHELSSGSHTVAIEAGAGAFGIAKLP
jgi:hypothetical protein